MTRWDHYVDAADIGVRGVGPTPADAFEQAALALTGVVTDPRHVAAEQPVAVHCQAPDLPSLLVAWLDELIYEMSERHVLFGGFEVEIVGGELHATAWGEPLDVVRHEPAVAEITGTRSTASEVLLDVEGDWVAQCIVELRSGAPRPP